MNPTFFEIDCVHLEFAHLTHECKLMVSIPGADFPRMLRRADALRLISALQVCVMEWDEEEQTRVNSKQKTVNRQDEETLYSPCPF